MRSLNLLGILVITLALTNCSKEVETSGSEVQHLSVEMPACAVDRNRADYLFTNLGPYVYGDRNLSYYMMQQISMAPAPLTDYLVARAQAGQFQIRFDLGNGYAGLTTGGFDMAEPSLIQFPAQYELVRQAALHELGHAVEYYSFRLAGKPGSEMNEVQNGYATSVTYEGQNMWSYSTSNRYEWFASAFSQYWCSQQSRIYMQAYFPNSAQFMKNLYSFLNRQDAGTNNPQPQASVDSDKDGVSDNDDFCPNTPAGSKVFAKGMYRGCAAGQNTEAMPGSANGDDDKDGIVNYFDLCPTTPSGRIIHRSGTYIGCAGGETPQDIKKLISGE